MESSIMRDQGFVGDDWSGVLLDWRKVTQDRMVPAAGSALDVPNTVAGDQLAPYFDTVAMIRISFPSFGDGRGFTLARHLRLLGYTGRLRAAGHVLPDQYAMVRRVGFDEVEIDGSLATSQYEHCWLARSGWQDHSYLKRLQKPA